MGDGLSNVLDSWIKAYSPASIKFTNKVVSADNTSDPSWRKRLHSTTPEAQPWQDRNDTVFL